MADVRNRPAGGTVGPAAHRGEALMAATSRPTFRGGPNVALKVPPSEYDATVRLYRDVLRLEVVMDTPPSLAFAFGPMTLWIDRVAQLAQPELWLEVQTDDTDRAARHLADHGLPRRDEIEPLPPDLDGFWVAGPGGIIHLVHKPA